MHALAPCPPLAELIRWLEPVFVPEQDVGKHSGPWLLREADVLFDQPRRYWERAGCMNLASQSRLQAGDVIVHPQYLHRATVVAGKFDGFVACAPLTVCRILDPARLLPAYLAWFLGSDLMKAALFDAMKITHRVVTGPQELGAITIPLASMAVQQQIARFWQDMVARERTALDLVAQMRKNFDQLWLPQVNPAPGTCA